jgi:hypothetical protein
LVLTTDAMGCREHMSWPDEGTGASETIVPHPTDDTVWKSRVFIQISRVGAAVWIVLACLTGAQLAGNGVALVLAEDRTKRDILRGLDLDGSRLRDSRRDRWDGESAGRLDCRSRWVRGNSCG